MVRQFLYSALFTASSISIFIWNTFSMCTSQEYRGSTSSSSAGEPSPPRTASPPLRDGPWYVPWVATW